MASEHELKCWPEPFDAVKRGEKTWEFRQNDRDFKVGDVLVLRKWDPYPWQGGGFGFNASNRGDYAPGIEPLRMRVTYILHGGQFGIPVSYCVMSIVPEDDDVK